MILESFIICWLTILLGMFVENLCDTKNGDENYTIRGYDQQPQRTRQKIK